MKCADSDPAAGTPAKRIPVRIYMEANWAPGPVWELGTSGFDPDDN